MRDVKTISIRGEITAKFYRQKNPYLRKWNRIVSKIAKKVNKRLRILLLNYLYFKGELVKVDVRKNVICKAGLSRVCGVLSNDLTISNGINKMALGTGEGTPSADDTKLFNEVYRNDTASGTYKDNVCYVTAFFTEEEVQGTFKEFGNFIDGGSGADSGYLWSHIAGLNWTKDDTMTLTIDCKYTFYSV